MTYAEQIRQEQQAIEVDLMCWSPFVAVEAHRECWVYCRN